MFERKRLIEAIRQERLEDGGGKNTHFAFAGKRKKQRFKAVYRAYLVTTVSVVLAVVLLFLFGVGSNGVALGGRFSLTGAVDKIGSLLLSLDFADISSEKADFDDGLQAIPPSGSQDTADKDAQKPSVETGGGKKDIYEFDHSSVPDGHTPIVPMDLSLIKYGEAYINNSTGLTPDVSWLLKKDLKDSQNSSSVALTDDPIVLIIHTHGTEAYSNEGSLYYPSDQTNYARSEDSRENVVAIGKTVAKILNDKGIPTAHCTVMHDSVQYKDSYARAEETIKRYLAEYPSIRLVIDIHRDSIVRSNGDLIRPIAEYKGEAAAQMMCVVGSDWEGQQCDNWENNLSLALKLRQKLNGECENICRPVNLKEHTYNQELSEYSLLIEVGSSGNYLSEAKKSAELLGTKLSELIKEI